jgi:hypothetical protein
VIYFLVFLFVFGNVAVRAFQQINVIHRHWLRIPPTSYAFALFDVLVVLSLVDVAIEAHSKTLTVFAAGTGGWMGCFFAMWLSKRLG